MGQTGWSSWSGRALSNPGARFRLRAQGPGREARDQVPKQSSARKTGSGPVWGAMPLGRGAAAEASPWVAGSIGNRLGSYVQRWAWARDVLLKAPPFHCDIIS